MIEFGTLLFWLLVGHAVADYPLQGDFLARGKNHTAPLPGVPWWICLLNHAAIHAGAVALVTGSVMLGLAEFVIHAQIDYLKCAGKFAPTSGTELDDNKAAEIAFVMDQWCHVATKIAIALLCVGLPR